MNTLDFYRAVLPGAGHFCLWWKGDKQHLWADSHEELAELTEARAHQPDWYYGTAGFSERQRKQKFVSGKRAFYFDLDCGPEKVAKHGEDKAYLSKKEAGQALAGFTRATGLHPSLLVCSGTGLHVYYVLDNDYPADEWEPVAVGLQELAVRHGLRVDSSVTSDSARILRPIGTTHGTAGPVYLLGQFDYAWSLDKVREITGTFPRDAGLSPAKREAKLDVNSKVFVEVPASAVKVAAKCAALRDIAAVRGDVPYEQWWTMIGLVKNCVEGEELAHDWSMGHDDYDPADVTKKFNSWEGAPPLCKTFEKFSKRCGECPHRGKISTPKQLGTLTDEQVAELPEDRRPKEPVPAEPLPDEFPELSAGFKIDKDDGGVYRLYYKKSIEKESEEGKTTLFVYEVLSRDVFWLNRWTDAGVSEYDGAQTSLHVWRNNRRIIFELPTKYIGSPPKLMEFLADKAITASGSGPAIRAKMAEYITSEFNRVKTMSSRPVVRNHFGLQYENDDTNAALMCAHGRYVIRKDQTVEEAMLSKRLRNHKHLFSFPLPPSPEGRWGPAVWKSTVMPAAQAQAKFIRDYYNNDEYKAAQLAIMLSIASPLLVFVSPERYSPGGMLPALGLTVSLYSRDSGKGKTTVQRVAAACYGSAQQMLPPGAKEDATPNALATRMSIMGTMPFHADEVTGNGPQETVSLVSRIANGTNRQRSDRSGDMRETVTWSMIGTVSTNIPQRELLAAAQQSSDALQMRLIEINCEFPERMEAEHTVFEERFKAEMAPNYGAIGALLHLAIVARGRDEVERAMAIHFKEAASHVPGSSHRHRFMQRGMACVLTAHRILSKMGIELFSRDVLLEQYTNAVKDSMEFAATVIRTPMDMLRTMVSDMASSIIVTEHESHALNDRRLDTVVNERTLRTPIVGRRVKNTGTLYILSDAIKHWAKEHQISYNEILRAAKQEGVLLRLSPNGMAGRVTLTKGTLLSTVVGLSYKFDEAKLMGEDEADMTNVVRLPTKESNDDDSGSGAAAPSDTQSSG